MALEEIRRQTRLLNLIVSVVILTLFIGIIAYLQYSISFLNNFREDLTLSLAVGAVIIFALSGLYMSLSISRSTLRIVEDYHGRLEKILNITRDLREEIYGDILLEKIMDYSLAITDSDAGSLVLSDAQGNLVFKLVRGGKADILVGKTLPKGSGIMGWVTESGAPLRIEDVAKDKRFNPDVDRTPDAGVVQFTVELRTKALEALSVTPRGAPSGPSAFRKSPVHRTACSGCKCRHAECA